MADQALEQCLCIEDVRKLALKRLPRPLFDIVEGFSEDGVTLNRNISDFHKIQILPRVLRGSSSVDLQVKIFDCDLSFPLILAPTGAQGILHPDGEIAAAKAAAKARIMYCLSCFSTETIEDVADSCQGPRLFQLNPLIDGTLQNQLIDRAKNAKFDVLCLTVDNPVSSQIENFERWQLSLNKLPPIRTIKEFLKRPRWLLRNRELKRRSIPYVVREMDPRRSSARQIISGFAKSAFRRDFSWRDAACLRKQWDGPFVLKGIQTVEDAKHALNIGVSGVIVCNHGGLALDGAPSAISTLPAVVEALGDKVEVLHSGGIRRGTSILKSIALGAEASLVGRAFLYGLAAGGERGVSHVISLLRNEFETALVASGCSTPYELSNEFINFSESLRFQFPYHLQ